ncbi:MAG: hypothetical protein ICV78_28335 [Tolypothrix sp. Co-bin9]|nr:hypothetical protein [Tolypothrix sp. Co-bin9]
MSRYPRWCSRCWQWLSSRISVVDTVGIRSSITNILPTTPGNSFSYLFLLYLMLGCSWFFIQRGRYPKMVRKMKREIETTHFSFTDAENIFLLVTLTTID